jgi:hypothetical protein
MKSLLYLIETSLLRSFHGVYSFAGSNPFYIDGTAIFTHLSLQFHNYYLFSEDNAFWSILYGL